MGVHRANAAEICLFHGTYPNTRCTSLLRAHVVGRLMSSRQLLQLIVRLDLIVCKQVRVSRRRCFAEIASGLKCTMHWLSVTLYQVNLVPQ